MAVDILSMFFRFACSEYGCKIIMLHVQNATNLSFLLLVDDDQRVYVIKIYSNALNCMRYNDCNVAHVVDDKSFIHEYVNLNI